MENPVEVPYQQLSEDALQSLLEDVATRDGTDYGEQEVPLETKVAQLKRQIQQGHAVIVFDPETESCNVISREEWSP